MAFMNKPGLHQRFAFAADAIWMTVSEDVPLEGSASVYLVQHQHEAMAESNRDSWRLRQ